MLILSLFTFYLRIAWQHLPKFFTRDLAGCWKTDLECGGKRSATPLWIGEP
jgi:hypothetical protein